MESHRTDGAEPLAPALATDSNQLLFKIEVVEVQAHQLADPQPAPIKCFQHRPITHPRRRVDRHRRRGDESPRQCEVVEVTSEPAWDYGDRPTGLSGPSPACEDTERMSVQKESEGTYAAGILNAKWTRWNPVLQHQGCPQPRRLDEEPGRIAQSSHLARPRPVLAGRASSVKAGPAAEEYRMAEKPEDLQIIGPR